MQKIELMVPGVTTTQEPLKVTSPNDGSLLAEVACADAVTIDHALQVAYALHHDDASKLSIEQRVAILTKVAQRMSDEIESLALLIAQEGAKPLVDARVEANRAVDGVRLCIEAIRTQSGKVIPMNLNAASQGRIAFSEHEPIGVVLAFSAFNHPLNLIVHQVGPAIAAGCPVIIKPSSNTPLSCMRFVQMLWDAGLPAAWCQALVCDVNLAGKLAADARISFFSFIGSARVGWMLRSKLAPGTRCSLEHGGVAPVIVEPDVELKKIVPQIGKGGFYHAGQVCVSVQRIYAHQDIARELANALVVYAQDQVVGDATSPDTDVGPLITTSEVERVSAWVQEAVDAGAELLCGGAEKVTERFYPCTVLYDPPEHVHVSKDEIFGPVICIYPYKDLATAIARANSLDVSFQAAVFTQNINNAFATCKKLNAATVMINDHTAFRVDWMPFAGLKHSGYGVGGIAYSMEDMQIEKLIVINTN